MGKITHTPISRQAARPRESNLKLFLRFLRFGLLAWGGPVAQIGMIRQELVNDEGWISNEQFNRVLAVYQVLPGPEAHELCVYFGMVARGRVGGFLGGLGFMLPGFVLMFGLSWLYAEYGITPLFGAIFYGFQPAVCALIVRAVHHIGRNSLIDRWLLGTAVAAGIAQVLGIHFAITLTLSGLTYALYRRKRYASAALVLGLLLASAVVLSMLSSKVSPSSRFGERQLLEDPSSLALFGSGLRSGLLTFGGAYTVIPFLQRDAVVIGSWMTNSQFLDGLALSGILPAPLVIFGTFVGYIGNGAMGALALTAGIFLPAFGFTLVGHNYLDKVIENQALHTFLDGVTAGVVGLIATTSIQLLLTAIRDIPTLAIFAAAMVLLYSWKSKAAVLGLMLGAGLLGWLLFPG